MTQSRFHKYNTDSQQCHKPDLTVQNVTQQKLRQDWQYKGSVSKSNIIFTAFAITPQQPAAI